MDFLALPRRDLQALCKRNGVRANMTSAAMADALRALPKVDGIEEYVKQPVPVPEAEVEAVEEEQNTGRQGSPLPRGRRVVAKSSEPIDLEEHNEEEKENAKWQPNKEDAQELGVGRRGASRRARPVSVVPQSSALAEDVSQGVEDLKREAKRDAAPALVVGRRGASRRARPSPAVAEPATESEVAGAEEEQREEVEDHKREASMDGVPPLGVGRRGASRRARPVASVALMAGKALREEEQRAPNQRCRRVKAMGSSTEPIRLDDSDDEEKEEAKPEGDQKDAQILGVGRRGGASRRAQAEPSAAAPEAKAEEEQRAPVPRGRRGKAMSTELIRQHDSKEKEDTKPEEERVDAPAISVARRGASRPAPALSEAQATMRSAASSKAEEEDVAVQDVNVPIRATRQRKPTMKAAAAAEEKAPRRATRRGAVMRTQCALLQPEVQDAPQEAAGAPDVTMEAVPNRATRQRKQTVKAAAAAATADEKAPPRATRRVMTTVLQEVQEELKEVVGAPNVAVEALPHRTARQRKPTMKAAAAETAKKAPPRATRRGTVITTVLQKEVQEEPQEVVGAPVSYQQCDTLEEVEEASDPQKEELHEADAAKQDENEDMFIIEDEKLIGETPTDDPPVTDQECTGKKEFQKQQVDDDKCHASLATQEESPILGLVSVVTKQPSEDDEVTNFQDSRSSSAVLLDKCVSEDTYDAGEEMELVPGVQALQAPLTGNISDASDASDANHESEMINFNEVLTVREEICEVDTQEVSKEKEDTYDAGEEMELVPGVHALQAPLTGNKSDASDASDANHESEMINLNEVLTVREEICEVDTQEVSKEKEDTCDAGEEMELVPGVQPLQAPLTGNKSDASNASHESEMINFNEVITVREEIFEVDTQDLSKEKEDMDNTEMLADIVDKAAFLDCSSNISQAAGEENNEEVNTAGKETNEEVNTDDGLGCQEEGFDKVLHDAVDNTILLDCSSDIGWVEMEKAENTTSMMPENPAALDEDGDKPNEVVTSGMSTVTDEIVQEEKGVMITDEMLQGAAGIHDDIEDPQFETVQADQGVTAENLLEQETVCKITKEDNAGLIVDERQQSTVTANGDIVDDQFKTHVAYADVQKKLKATEVLEVTGTYSEIEEKTTVIVNEKKPSMDGDVAFDHLKTDTAHADEQKEMSGIVTEAPDEVTGIDDDVIEERAFVIIEDIPNQGAVSSTTHTIDGCVKENHFGNDFGHGNDEKKAIAADTESEVSRARDGIASKENALLDGVTESLSKGIIIMEPSVCKNSCKINTGEPMAVLEDELVKAASESEDLTKLSLGQLRAMLKEKLNAKKNKEAKKRVALARVDENVCRSHSKEQQQNLNMQQH